MGYTLWKFMWKLKFVRGSISETWLFLFPQYIRLGQDCLCDGFWLKLFITLFYALDPNLDDQVINTLHAITAEDLF